MLWNFCKLKKYKEKFKLFAAAAAKLLQSCPTLCDPIYGSPPGSPIPGILQARKLEWVAISFSKAWKWKVKVRLLSRAAYQAPPSMGFSRQEYWCGVPWFPKGSRELFKLKKNWFWIFILIMQNILSPWCLLNLFIPIYSLKPFSTSHPPPSFPSFCLLPSLLSFFISLIFSNTVGKSHLSSILALVWETGDLSLWLDDNTNFWLYMIFSSVQFSSIQSLSHKGIP